MTAAADAGTAWLDILPRIGADFGRRLRSGIGPGLDGASEDVESKMGGAFKRVAAIAAGAFAAVKVGEFFKGAIDGASDLAESVSKNKVVFGEASQRISDFAKNSDTALGQSKGQALEATGVFGNLLRAVGLTEEKSADLSIGMVTLASDLASFNNTSVDDALQALRSGLVGETEPLKRFGVNMNEATLKAKAMELGLSDGKSVLDANAKAQAAYALIMDQTSLAQGDFARTSDGLANKQKILSAQWTNMKAKLGAALLGPMTAVTAFGSSVFLPFVERLSKAFVPVVKEITGGVRAMFAAFKAGDGDVTSSGFAGQLERIGAVARRVFDFVKDGIASLVEAFTSFRKVGEWEAHGNFERLGVVLAKIVDFVKSNLKPILMTIGVIVLGTVVPAFVAWAAATIAATLPIVALGAAVFGAIKLLQRFPGIADAVGAAAKWIGEQFSNLVDWAKKAWPQVQQVIEHVVNVIVGLWRTWGDDLLRIANAAWKQVQNVVETAVDIVRGVIQTVMALINGDFGKAWDGLKGIVKAAWDFIFETVRNLGGIVAGLIGGLFDAARTVLGKVLGDVVDFFAELPGRLASAAGDLFGWIGEKISSAVDRAKGIGEGLLDFFRDLPGRLADAAGDVFGFLVDAIKSAVRGIVRAWNSVDLKVPKIHIPGTDIDFGGFDLIPDLPMPFHKGGIVPGMPGEEVFAVLKAGEEVIPAGEDRGGKVVNNQIAVDARGTDWAPLHIAKAIAWELT